MRYLIEEYDNNGYLKAPIWLWLSWLFLARAWVVFVLAAVTREKGSEILSLIYPISANLYTMMWMGVPSLLLMWLIGLRNPERPMLNHFIRWGRVFTIVIAVAQLILEGRSVLLQHGQFSWGGALSLVGLCWILIYLFNSRRVKDCFSSIADH